MNRAAGTGIAALACLLLFACLVAWAFPAQAHATNLDRYIGLSPKVLVIATADTDNWHYKPIYRKADANSKKISRIQGRSCLVCDTSKMKKGKDHRFVKVLLPNCKPSYGYIKASAFTFGTIDTRDFGLASKAGKNAQRVTACRYALRLLGVKYSRANSTDPKRGLNCIQIMVKSYNKAGVKLWVKRAKSLNRSRYGKEITRDALRPGDAVFYKGVNGRSYNHVALYLGNGYVVQSSVDKGRHYPTGGVRITKLKFRSVPQKYRNIIG